MMMPSVYCYDEPMSGGVSWFDQVVTVAAVIAILLNSFEQTLPIVLCILLMTVAIPCLSQQTYTYCDVLHIFCTFLS